MGEFTNYKDQQTLHILRMLHVQVTAFAASQPDATLADFEQYIRLEMEDFEADRSDREVRRGRRADKAADGSARGSDTAGSLPETASGLPYRRTRSKGVVGGTDRHAGGDQGARHQGSPGLGLPRLRGTNRRCLPHSRRAGSSPALPEGHRRGAAVPPGLRHPSTRAFLNLSMIRLATCRRG